MAPSPQTYGQPSGYQQEQPQYGAELGANEQPQPPQALYGAGPQSYGKQQQQAGSYGRQPAASSYGQPAGGYAKPAARYEEPYVSSGRRPMFGTHTHRVHWLGATP